MELDLQPTIYTIHWRSYLFTSAPTTHIYIYNGMYEYVSVCADASGEFRLKAGISQVEDSLNVH